MTFIYLSLALAGLLLIMLIVLFNTLVARRNMVKNGWADIDVQLKRRADLIPQLVNTVQGYAGHEQTLFEEVIERRNAALQSGDDPLKRGHSESELSRPVGRLLALAEAYPDLKASDNFVNLQNELTDTENKIEMARRFYNGAVREMNVSVQSFPGNLVAGLFRFRTAAFFEISISDRAMPEIDLGGAH